MGQLIPITDGIFGVETTFAVVPGVHLPLRMTVLVGDDGVTLVCPITIDDALAAEIAEQGTVTQILATNRFHHAFLGAAAERYPAAIVLGAPGLAEKKPKVSFHGVLEAGRVSETLTGFFIDGAKEMSEVVLLHEPTKTLIVTDLVFNVRGVKGWSKFVLNLVSRALNMVEQSRLVRRFTDDRAKAGASVEHLLTQDFDRLITAHGEVVQTDAKNELRRATWWMRGESKRPA